MSSPTYQDVSLSWPANVLQGSVTFDSVISSDLGLDVLQQVKLPALKALNVPFGTGAGKVNRRSKFYSGTLNPGDIFQVDLLSYLDDFTNTVTDMSKLVMMAIFNFSNTDGANLDVGGNTLIPGAIATGAASGADGTIPAGSYLGSYTLVNANGESLRSADSAAVVVSATNHITWTFPALPTGAVSRNMYVSTTNGNRASETKQNGGTPITTTTYTQTALAAGASPPTVPAAYYGGLITPFRNQAAGGITVGPGFLSGSAKYFNYALIGNMNTAAFAVGAGASLVQLFASGSAAVSYGLVFWGRNA